MKIRYYTGVGSRTTPAIVQERMERLARQLALLGIRLRSGHASGADQAFERACLGIADIFVPNGSFEANVPINGTPFVGVTREAFKLASEHHPGWRYLTAAGQALHARDCFEVLGYDLKEPSDFLICWTPGGKGRGGTGTALSIARAYNIPTFDMGCASGLTRLQMFIDSGFMLAPPETKRTLTATTLDLPF